MRIYLAGSVAKGKNPEKHVVGWRKKYSIILKEIFPDVEFIDPSVRDIDESDFEKVVGLDCKHIKNCDLVIVNAEWRLGVGTSQEIIIAKYFGKPVITVAPLGGLYRKKEQQVNNKKVENWVHPFIFVFSDLIIDRIEDLDKEEVVRIKPKDISIIDQLSREAD